MKTFPYSLNISAMVSRRNKLPFLSDMRLIRNMLQYRLQGLIHEDQLHKIATSFGYMDFMMDLIIDEAETEKNIFVLARDIKYLRLLKVLEYDEKFYQERLLERLSEIYKAKN